MLMQQQHAIDEATIDRATDQSDQPLVLAVPGRLPLGAAVEGGVDAQMGAELDAGIGARNIEKPAPSREQILTCSTALALACALGVAMAAAWSSLRRDVLA
jgi:hypothetical protein